MVAERGRGEGGRGDGGSNGRKRRRRRVAALVAPKEGGGHRGAGTVADGDSPKEDESSLRPGDPGTSSEATTGASGSTAICVWLSARERRARAAARQERALKMAAPESHRCRPARTAQARSAGAYQALGPAGERDLGCGSGGPATASLSAGAPFWEIERGDNKCGRALPSRQHTKKPGGSCLLLRPPGAPCLCPRASRGPEGRGPGWSCSTLRSGRGGREGSDTLTPLPHGGSCRRETGCVRRVVVFVSVCPLLFHLTHRVLGSAENACAK